MSSLNTLRVPAILVVAAMLSACGKDPTVKDPTVDKAGSAGQQHPPPRTNVAPRKPFAPPAPAAQTPPTSDSEPTFKGKNLSQWIKQLDSDNIQDRQQAVDSIKGLRSAKKDVEAAIPALTSRLQDESPAVRHSAAHLLIAIRGQEAHEAVTYLTATANDPKAPLSRQAALALEAFKLGPQTPEAKASNRAKVLIKQLQGPDDSSRRRAAEELESIARLHPAKMQEEAITALIAALKEDKDVKIRVLAASALRWLKSEAAVGALVAALEDNELSVATRAANALGEIGPPARAAAPALVKVLSVYKTGGPGNAAAQALPRLGPASAPAVRPLLQDQNVVLRREAARILFRLGADAKEANAELTKALHDPDVFVCITAAGALIELQGNDAKDALTVLDQAFKIHALRPGYPTQPSIVAANTVRQMSKIGKAIMFPALIEWLKNGTLRDDSTAAEQVRVLRDLAGPEHKAFVPVLLELAQTKSRMSAGIGEVVRKIDPGAALKAGIR